MGYQNTISGKEFCKKNCGKIGKAHFYEEYYRILHTSYLKSKEIPCIEIIRGEFQQTFGAEPDNDSISYIYANAKYFVYDVVVEALLGDGKIDSRFYYNRLAIEIGFDVWLMNCMEEHHPLEMKAFCEWLPLEKGEKTERAVNDFWYFRLPKAKNFERLYEFIRLYRDEIYLCYYKLVKENSNEEDDATRVAEILQFLSSEVMVPAQEESALTSEASAAEKSPAVDNSSDAEEKIAAGENLLDPIPATDEILLDTILAVDEAAEDIIPEVKEAAEEILPKVKAFSKEGGEKQRSEQALRPKITVVSSAKESTPAPKGFATKKSCFTKEKLTTAAKCLAIAGVLLVPLIAYQCLKKK